MNNLRLVPVGDITNRDPDEVSESPDDYVARLFPCAKFIQSGQYGSVFSVACGAKSMPAVKALLGAMTHVTRGERGVPSGRFVIKVTQHKPDYATWPEFVDTNLHEASVHSFLSKRTTCAPVRCSQAKVCSAAVVPEFILAGAIRKAGLFVTFMEHMEGVSLKRYINTHGVSAMRYAIIEKAVATLWMVGVSHSDLHMDNAMILKDGRVVILDFGMAVLLPAALRNRVVRELGNMPALRNSLANTVWYAKNTIQNYTNAIQNKRTEWYPNNQERYYNPEGKLLRALWNRVARQERSKISGLRAKLWGCGTAANK